MGAVIEQKEIQMCIDCGGLMQLARERFYENHDIVSAMNILMGITNCDQLTKEEQEILCLEILMYKKDIVGIYPREEVRIIDCTKKIYDFFGTIDNLSQKIKNSEEEYNSLLQKFLFLRDKTDESYLKALNDSYYFETGEYLFEEDFAETSNDEEELFKCKTYKKNDEEVESYLKRMADTQSHSTEDYGWLSPEGKFFDAPFGHHNEWARKYLEKNDPEFDEIYSDKCKDKLIELHWVLLDSPYGGIATPKFGHFGMTKAQKEFLYDYYMERNLVDEANKIWDM